MGSFLARLAEKPETEAVVVLSNAAGASDRLPFDERSDFDVGLVLDVPVYPEVWRPEPWATYQLIRDRLPTWLPNFSFSVPVPWGALEINVHQLIYQYEADDRTAWDDAKCEAYAGTGRVVFDRTGRFEALIRRKARARDSTLSSRLVRIASRLEWDIEVLPRRQADRGELLAAHYIVTRAIDELVEICFLLARRYVPNQKWRFYLLRQQGVLSVAEIAQLERALHCDPTSRQDLERRISELANLWASIRRRSPEVPDDPYRVYAATQIQLTAATFADTLRENFGEQASDLANYLLAHSPESVAAALSDGGLVEEWVDQDVTSRDLMPFRE